MLLMLLSNTFNNKSCNGIGNSVHAVQLFFLIVLLFIAFSHLCVYRLWLYGFALTHSLDAVRVLSSALAFVLCVRECVSVVQLLLFSIQTSVSIYQNVHDD